MLGLIFRALVAAGGIASYMAIFRGYGEYIGRSLAGFLSGLGIGAKYAGYGVGAGFYGLSAGLVRALKEWVELGRMIYQPLESVRIPQVFPEVKPAMRVVQGIVNMTPPGMVYEGIKTVIEHVEPRTHENMKKEEGEWTHRIEAKMRAGRI